MDRFSNVSSLKRPYNLQQHFWVLHKPQLSGSSHSLILHLPKDLPIASPAFLSPMVFVVWFDSASLAFCRERGVRMKCDISTS